MSNDKYEYIRYENEGLLKDLDQKRKEIEKYNIDNSDLIKNAKDKVNIYFQVSKQYIKKSQNIVFMLEKIESSTNNNYYNNNNHTDLNSFSFNKNKDKEKLFTELCNNLDYLLNNINKPDIITSMLDNTGKKDFITNLKDNDDNLDDLFSNQKELLYIETIKKLEGQFKNILEKNKEISEEKYKLQIETEKKLKEKYNKKIEDLKILCADKDKKLLQLKEYAESFENKLEGLENENNKAKVQLQKVSLIIV